MHLLHHFYSSFPPRPILSSFGIENGIENAPRRATYNEAACTPSSRSRAPRDSPTAIHVDERDTRRSRNACNNAFSLPRVEREIYARAATLSLSLSISLGRCAPARCTLAGRFLLLVNTLARFRKTDGFIRNLYICYDRFFEKKKCTYY